MISVAIVQLKALCLRRVRLLAQLDSTRRKASEICLRPPLDIYFHTFSR